MAPLWSVWWLSRPLGRLGRALLLTPVVVVLAPVEHSTPRPSGDRTGGRMVVACVTAAGAIAQVTLGGVLGWPALVAAIGFTLAAASSGAFGTPRRRGESAADARCGQPTSVVSRSS